MNLGKVQQHKQYGFIPVTDGWKYLIIAGACMGFEGNNHMDFPDK